MLYGQEKKGPIAKNKVQHKSLGKLPTKISDLPKAKVIYQQTKGDSAARDLEMKSEVDNKIRKTMGDRKTPSDKDGSTIKVIYSNSKD